ncbi:hypothetical protein E9232_004680 [Inquilinus ginsengisoli]|uniref:Uncharacterized protein n=1 Tax=Inquilinus ginsengisoli TaxID=363840 RepID=A0ABU1JU56_9PROT|nr:hypothetical protein [Inquilinus ginsengisoli]MDR6292142.1 hypothetical protein [Inquilinus ginsengisoli]
MNKTQTAQTPEAPAAPEGERAARHLRLLARAAEIQMEVMEATRTEALGASQPGVDYCGRLAVLARSLRLTLLLEEKMARPREEPGAAVPVKDWHRRRVSLAIASAIRETAESADEVYRRCAETLERLEEPELAEKVDGWPAELAVAQLCRMYGLPLEVQRWLDEADDLLAKEEEPAPVDRPADPPEPRAALAAGERLRTRGRCVGWVRLGRTQHPATR